MAREARAAPPPPARAFVQALRGADLAVIAEVKRRSPSAGLIAPGLEPLAYARACVAGGARAFSVLTNRTHFGGSLADLRAVAGAVPVPVLRKDFILDEVQLLEARAAGAAAVLLIVRALSAAALGQLHEAALGLGLATLVEIHDERELERALALAPLPTAIGVNARDLNTFAVDPDRVAPLVAAVPAALPAVAESGVSTREDVERLAGAGADAVLVGTALARSADAGAAVGALTGVTRRGR